MRRILVIGDIIADVYRECIFKKMCPDNPDVQAIVEHSREIRPGGAANVAVNLAALAPDVQISLIGDIDVETARVVKQLSKNRVSMEHCTFSDPGKILTKERLVLDGKMVLRVDNRPKVDRYVAERIEQHLREYLSEHDPDLVVMSDYAGGTINGDTLAVLLSMRGRLLVDTKLTDLSVFGSDGQKTKLIKLNHLEWESVIQTEAAPERFFETLIVTEGSGGSTLRMRTDVGSRSMTHVMQTAAFAVNGRIDVCGCGDTFLAGLAAFLIRTDDVFTAMQFANAASATVVTMPRTSVADLEQTKRLLGWE